MDKYAIIGWGLLIGIALGGYQLGKKVGVLLGKSIAYDDCRNLLMEHVDSLKTMDD